MNPPIETKLHSHKTKTREEQNQENMQHLCIEYPQQQQRHLPQHHPHQQHQTSDTMMELQHQHQQLPQEQHHTLHKFHIKSGDSIRLRRRSSMRLSTCDWTNQVVRDMAVAIQDCATSLTRGARFVNTAPIETPIAPFHRQEIHIGKLLGKGGFSRVYECTAFLLNNEEKHTSKDNSSQRRESQLARRVVEGTATNHRGETTYAIKHLDKDLLLQKGPDEFQCAAADLFVEARYMARFNHPNILKLRGMARGGTSAYADGQFDSFFLLTDKLTDTLDQRIARWKQEGNSHINNQDMLTLKSYYGLQMADALRYLHDRRIIFRDLKPQNIGFKDTHTIQLYDFGLCRELPDPRPNGHDDDVYLMSDAGTRRYMAVGKFFVCIYTFACTFDDSDLTCSFLFS